MQNHVSIAQFCKMDGDDVQRLSLDDLVMLQDELTEKMKKFKMLEGVLNTEKERRFTPIVAIKRECEQALTGTVRIQLNDGYELKADLPKNVEWDQATLANIYEKVRAWGDHVNEYIDTKYSIPETKYVSWPTSLQKVFEPARTVKTGKPSFKLIMKGES